MDELDAKRSAMLALESLQALAHVVPARIGMHREHIGPMGEAAVAQPAHPEHEAEHLAVLGEGTGADAAQLLHHDENGGRDFISITDAPDEFLECNTLGAVSVAFEVAIS